MRQSLWPLDITDHSLVTARSSDENSEAAFVEISARALCQGTTLDLIVSIGAPAAAFVQRHRQQLFPYDVYGIYRSGPAQSSVFGSYRE